MLNKYVVTLKEDPEDKFTWVFECMAENADHAEEQAENAYPDCWLMNTTLLEDGQMQTNDAVEVSEEYSTVVELLDAQFDKGWDAGVQAAFDIVQEVLGSGADLAAICARFMRELEMKDD